MQTQTQHKHTRPATAVCCWPLYSCFLLLLYCCFTASLTTAYKRPATAIGNQKLNHSLSLKLPFSLKKKKIRGGGGER